MIVDAIRKLYEADAEDHVGRGNPTGSRFGSCAAQTQFLRYRALSNPESPRPRHRISWEEGDRVEAWWSSVIERAFPNLSGMQQEPFYFAVPLPADYVNSAMIPVDLVGDFTRRITLHQEQSKLPAAERDPAGIWGTVRAGFKPPHIREGATRIEVKTVARDPSDPTKPARLGFVLDPEAAILWAPTYVDRVLFRQDDVGLSVIEKKSASNAIFRRALQGNLGYGMRCQGAGLVAATGLPITWLIYRKETGHLLELVYTPKADRVRVEIRKLNGQSEVYFRKLSHPLTDVASDAELVDDDEEPLPGDAEWDDAATWTPYDVGSLEAIRARILRVLTFTGDLATVYREYGPTFTCPTCDGTRTQVRVRNGRKLLKAPKPCEYCTDGRLEAVELPFPCSYCGVVRTCYKDAGYSLTLDQKPHHYVTRAAFESSGLSFVSPEAPTVPPPAPIVSPEPTNVPSSGAEVVTPQLGQDGHGRGPAMEEIPPGACVEGPPRSGESGQRAVTPSPEGLSAWSVPTETVTPKQGALDW